MQETLEAEGIKLPKTTVKKSIDALKSAILTNVEEGLEVHIPGFMHVCLNHRNSRTGYNVNKGENFTIPERIAVNIKPASTLQNAAKELTDSKLNEIKARKKK